MFVTNLYFLLCKQLINTNEVAYLFLHKM